MSKFGVIWVIFWQNMAIFGHFWTFWPIIRGKWRKCLISVIIALTFTAITPEPSGRFRKFWAFRKSHIRGYYVSRFRTKSVILGSTPPPQGLNAQLLTSQSYATQSRETDVIQSDVNANKWVSLVPSWKHKGIIKSGLGNCPCILNTISLKPFQRVF